MFSLLADYKRIKLPQELRKLTEAGYELGKVLYIGTALDIGYKL